MLQPADLLVLDEPTNDLDIPTLEVLEESLARVPRRGRAGDARSLPVRARHDHRARARRRRRGDRRSPTTASGRRRAAAPGRGRRSRRRRATARRRDEARAKRLTWAEQREWEGWRRPSSPPRRRSRAARPPRTIRRSRPRRRAGGALPRAAGGTGRGRPAVRALGGAGREARRSSRAGHRRRPAAGRLTPAARASPCKKTLTQRPCAAYRRRGLAELTDRQPGGPMPRCRVLLLAAVAVALSARGGLATFTTFESGHVRPLALSPDGTRLFAVNTPDDRLEIFSVSAGPGADAPRRPSRSGSSRSRSRPDRTARSGW